MFGREQYLTVKLGENIFTARPKILFQSFASNPEMSVFYHGTWYPVQITAIEEEHTLFRLTTVKDRSLVVTGNHIIQTSDGKAHYVQDLRLNQSLMIESNPCEKIETDESKSDQIKDIQVLTPKDNWVFSVKLLTNQTPYFTISNGIISRSDL